MKYILLVLTLFSPITFAAETVQDGNVTNITSIKEGLLIILDTGKPSGCKQTSGWMLIPEENKTMVSVALAMHLAGKKRAAIYVDIHAPGGYCKVIQYDPL
ncbi:hypothetical protein [Aliikangiella coralliicola]|uniref:Uncharacterized protein n=1 Tax=Aliikangiella coralliicola TaxID=2592383 RepID=A0A545UC80_9GAMM|nr:hypothetical protein [Aliikangiella coralliicola]TQV87081.1 hypothetical protein FLL46_14850 [Aliikangiella coralliicola]